jgi:hypothetical protein
VTGHTIAQQAGEIGIEKVSGHAIDQPVDENGTEEKSGHKMVGNKKEVVEDNGAVSGRENEVEAERGQRATERDIEIETKEGGKENRIEESLVALSA